LIVEYFNNPKLAKTRYAGTEMYDKVIEEIQEALNAKVEQVVTSGRLYYSGFPLNMGEGNVKISLESFGPLKDFSCEESDDGMSLCGRAEFEDAKTAKAAIDKYDGTDMGMGTTLELKAL